MTWKLFDFSMFRINKWYLSVAFGRVWLIVAPSPRGCAPLPPRRAPRRAVFVFFALTREPRRSFGVFFGWAKSELSRLLDGGMGQIILHVWLGGINYHIFTRVREWYNSWRFELSNFFLNSSSCSEPFLMALTSIIQGYLRLGVCVMCY